MSGGYAVAPPEAPPRVQAAIDAGNQIAGAPYRYGGGHADAGERGFDCSGAASHVLRAAGAMSGAMPSSGFRHFGESGPGEWISIYARKDHTFLVVAGLRFDTGYTGLPRGPQWSIKGRPAKGSVVRHPDGL